jgi:hypothetical protein
MQSWSPRQSRFHAMNIDATAIDNVLALLYLVGVCVIPMPGSSMP